MKHYELTYLINPELTQEQIANVEETVKKHIQAKKGCLDKAFKKPISLGYPIKKKKTAIMSVLNFSLPSTEIEKLRQKLYLEKEILRFMLITKKLVKPKEKSKIRKSKPIFISKKSASLKKEKETQTKKYCALCL